MIETCFNSSIRAQTTHQGLVWLVLVKNRGRRTPTSRQTDIIKLSFILMSSIKKWDLHSEIILLVLRVGVVR